MSPKNTNIESIAVGELEPGSLFKLSAETYRLINLREDFATVALQEETRTQVSREPAKFVKGLKGIEVSTIPSDTQVEKL